MKKKRPAPAPKKRTSAAPRREPRITIPDCRRFTGYKPCFPGTTCYERCVDPAPRGTSILVVNLDAMGNVLVTTSLLPAIKRKYPESTIEWITLKNAAPLLENNPLLHRVHVWEPESWLELQQRRFDVVMNVDKSRRSGAFTMSLNAAKKTGFGIDRNGVIVPLNREARYNYLLGLDDHLKFRVNTKSVSRILCETFGLRYMRDEYILRLTPDEEAYCRSYRADAGLDDAALTVGFNTGCSELYPNKKMTVEQHLALIERLAEVPGVKLVLAGGPEDTLRNAEIARRAGAKVHSTPTTDGLRRGLCYLNICDLVITGDSFGMHAAIALRKEVVAWFGLSCWTEIDLFGRGITLIPEGLACAPCWKRECPYNLECRQMVDLDAIVAHVRGAAAARAGRARPTPA